MRIAGWALLWGLIGLVVGYGAILGLGIVAFEVFHVSQREGAAAMGLAFFIAPAGAVVIAAISAAVAMVVLTGRTPQGPNSAS